MAAIYLVRHGQASFGTSDYDRLSETGQAQARRLGQYWADKGLRPDQLLSGSLKRQIDSARLMAEGLSEPLELLDPDTRFNEFDHEKVAAAMLPRLAARDSDVADFVAGKVDRKKAFQRVFEKIVEEWTSRDHWGDGLEAWPAFVDRVYSGFDELIRKADAGSNLVVFTSGGPITGILARLLKLDPETAFSLNWSIANASVTKIQFSQSGRTSLAYFNHYAYLQAGSDRSLITMR